MYTDYFGFIEKPFNVTPDPRFLYLSSAHQEALAAMLYGIQEKRGFISIIGEVGTGKTTLLRTLLRELDNDTETVLIFNTQVTFEQLLKNILWELNISFTDQSKPELINLLNHYLITKLSAGENVAIIIDEAQNLPSKVLEDLRMLSNLETEKEKLLQIILTGQPELLTKLNSPSLRQLKQRIGINCFLTPLNDEDRMIYIAHRLSIAGSKDNTIFSKKALELICDFSKGIPRVINILCDNALLSAYGKDCRRINTPIVEEVIADYSRSTVPEYAEEPASTTLPSNTKTFFTKSKAALILFVFTLLILSALGLSAYGSKIYPFNQLMNDMFSELSLQWEKIEWTFKDTPLKNQLQQPPTAHEPPSEETTEQTLLMEHTQPATDSILSIAEEPATSEQIMNQHQQPSAAPAPPGEETTEQILLMEHTQPDTDSVLSITEEPATSEQIISSPVHQSTFPDVLPPLNNATNVYAQKGDMVSTLIIRQYGISNDTIFDIVKRANPKIEDLDKIDIGQNILFPSLNIDNFIIQIAQNIYSIHMASFNSYAQAKYYLNQLQGLQHPLFLSPVKIAGTNPWYRITIGGFNTREAARDVARSILSENHIMAKIISENQIDWPLTKGVNK